MIRKIPDVLAGGIYSDRVCAEKVNELVDAINDLQAKEDEIKEWIYIVSDLREQVKQLNRQRQILCRCI